MMLPHVPNALLPSMLNAILLAAAKSNINGAAAVALEAEDGTLCIIAKPTAQLSGSASDNGNGHQVSPRANVGATTSKILHSYLREEDPENPYYGFRIPISCSSNNADNHSRSLLFATFNSSLGSDDSDGNFVIPVAQSAIAQCLLVTA